MLWARLSAPMRCAGHTSQVASSSDDQGITRCGAFLGGRASLDTYVVLRAVPSVHLTATRAATAETGHVPRGRRRCRPAEAIHAAYHAHRSTGHVCWH